MYVLVRVSATSKHQHTTIQAHPQHPYTKHPRTQAGELAHRRKWRAELCCARFLNQDLDRAKILMALKVTDAQGWLLDAYGPDAQGPLVVV